MCEAVDIRSFVIRLSSPQKHFGCYFEFGLVCRELQITTPMKLLLVAMIQKEKTVTSRLLKVVLTELDYAFQKDRNARLFQERTRAPGDIARASYLCCFVYDCLYVSRFNGIKKKKSFVI